MSSVPYNSSTNDTVIGSAKVSAVAQADNLLTRLEAVLTKLEAKAKADEVSVKAVLSKYWPIAVGIVIAATRFIKL